MVRPRAAQSRTVVTPDRRWRVSWRIAVRVRSSSGSTRLASRSRRSEGRVAWACTSIRPGIRTWCRASSTGTSRRPNADAGPTAAIRPASMRIMASAAGAPPRPSMSVPTARANGDPASTGTPGALTTRLYGGGWARTRGGIPPRPRAEGRERAASGPGRRSGGRTIGPRRPGRGRGTCRAARSMRETPRE